VFEREGEGEIILSFFPSLLQFRWHSIKPNKDELSLDITSASADLLTSLRYHLSFLDLYLSPSLTVDTFETLATRIDKLLVTEVHIIIIIHNVS
jgi:hypothetical protein